MAEQEQDKQEENGGITETLDKLKAENEKTEKLLKRQEELAARNMLSGKTENSEEKPQKKEETDAEYTRRIEEEIRQGRTDFSE